MGIASYSKKGLYNSYDKNNKERDALDYYSTPIEEVTNILEIIKNKTDITTSSILEPCAGGGHMLQGILNADIKNNIIATDIKDRGNITNIEIKTGSEFDFISDNYPIQDIDYIIMNPPYSVIEPFVMKALSIANKGILMLGRLQFLEGEKRFENIFKECPPTDVYIYVDRIYCFKNGDLNQKMSSAQAYAWFYWDTQNIGNTNVHWIRRNNKK